MMKGVGRGGRLSAFAPRGLSGVFPTVPLWVFTGESNASGYALNSEATAGEVASRSSVKILNNTSLVWQDLDVGTNGNIDGGPLITAADHHGPEISLANMVEAGRLAWSSVYLVKSAYAGSVIANWDYGQQRWIDLVDRVNAAVALLNGSSIPYTPIIFYSQGINDSVDSVPAATWKAATIAHFAKLRTLLGANTKILATKLPLDAFGATTIPDYNTALDEIAAADPLTLLISITGAGMRDSAHWNAAGFRTIGERAMDLLWSDTAPAVTSNVASGTYETAQSVTLSTTGDSIRYTTSGVDPISSDTLASGAIAVAASTTIKARAISENKKLGDVSSFAIVISNPLKWDSAKKSSNVILYNSDLDMASEGGTNFNMALGTIGRSTGKHYFELQLSAYVGANPNHIIMGIGTTTGAYTTNWPGSYATSGGLQGHATEAVDLRNGFTAGVNLAAAHTAVNDILGFAVDLDAGKVWVSKNGTFNQSQNPAGNATPWSTFTTPKTLYPAGSLFGNNAANRIKLLSGSGLAYSPPSGFSTW